MEGQGAFVSNPPVSPLPNGITGLSARMSNSGGPSATLAEHLDVPKAMGGGQHDNLHSRDEFATSSPAAGPCAPRPFLEPWAIPPHSAGSEGVAHLTPTLFNFTTAAQSEPVEPGTMFQIPAYVWNIGQGGGSGSSSSGAEPLAAGGLQTVFHR
jgi:hypothetical protein